VTNPRKKESAVKEAIRSLLVAGPQTRQQLIRSTKASPSQVTKKLNELRDEVGVIQFRRDGQDWFQLPAPGVTKFEVRKRLNKGLKEEISKYVYELILGPEVREGVSDEVTGTCKALLEQIGAEGRGNLLSIYASRERTVIVDGGSTTYYVTERLKSVSLPSERYRVWRLLVVTNCPPIAESLYEAPTGPDVVLIGGRISRDTRSISGHLAEAAITEWDIEADFSIVGASGLELPRGFCNYSEGEAAVKGMLLRRGRIKCVVMDSSKITGPGMGRSGMSFCFAPASKSAVDVLISDSGMLQHKTFCEELKMRGIVILPQEDRGRSDR
jgi:DeoR/GlpR family transcriptional regulator of sugar metabolism